LVPLCLCGEIGFIVGKGEEAAESFLAPCGQRNGRLRTSAVQFGETHSPQNSIANNTSHGGNLITEEDPVTPERFRSATVAIRRVLQGSTCLKEWDTAFSQVIELSGRTTTCATDESAALVAARNEYRAALREWYEQLPRLRGWLLVEKTRLEARRAHETGLRAWFGAHGQTR